MKILFIAYSNHDPASRYRIKQYIPYFSKSNNYTKYFCLYPNIYVKPWIRNPKILYWFLIYFFNILRLFSFITIICKARLFDAIIINRPIFPNPKIYLIEKIFLKLYGNKIIFDFDDAIHLVGNSAGMMKTKFYLLNSKMAFAGNYYLADFAIKYNQNTKLFPTVVNTELYIVKNYSIHSNLNTKTVIGWTGSNSTQLLCLPKISEVLIELNKINKSFKFMIISDQIPTFSWLKDLDWHYEPWDESKEVDLLHQFDIGIMPLNDTLFEKGKCGLKLIQYGGIGLPSVASPIGVNMEIIEHGKTGYLADSVEDWVRYLDKLLKSKTLRMEMGKAARIRIQNHYSLSKNIPIFVESLHNITN